MNAIVGMTKIAASHMEAPEKVRDCLKKIDLSGRLLVGLINDSLDMSKIESGKMTLNNETRRAAMNSGLCSYASLSGADLLAILDYGATSAEEQKSGRTSRFHPFAVSGVTLTYDLNGEEGRVYDDYDQ